MFKAHAHHLSSLISQTHKRFGPVVLKDLLPVGSHPIAHELDTELLFKLFFFFLVQKFPLSIPTHVAWQNHDFPCLCDSAAVSSEQVLN